jgi:EAL domain-containing protein (putative c-di-GMP-specific phosphodiesterase class I)/GGDEF domain-containing protein
MSIMLESRVYAKFAFACEGLGHGLPELSPCTCPARALSGGGRWRSGRAAGQTMSEMGLAASAAGKRYLAVAGLDRFAALRRRVSYEVASGILAQVAARIEDHLQSCDTSIVLIGRASIEFVFRAADDLQAESMLERLCSLLEEESWSIDGHSFKLSSTIGFAEAPEGSLTDRVFDRAAYALSRARQGKQKVGHAKAVDLESEIYGNLSLMRDLRGAIARGDLQLFYQPKLDARSGALHSVEALLRWFHADHGLLRTDKLIELAENSGYIRELTEWAVERAISEQQQMTAAGHPARVFLNLSGILLADTRFANWMLAQFAGREQWFGLEITETAVIDDPDAAIANLRAFVAAGIEIAIDDYGSGLSSLDYLKRLPASELKIDRSFIARLTESHRDPLIVRSSIDLAHALDMKVTAEGVDNPMTLSLLRVMGCDILQGFFIARPLAIDKLITCLDAGFDHVNGGAEPFAALQRPRLRR